MSGHSGVSEWVEETWCTACDSMCRDVNATTTGDGLCSVQLHSILTAQCMAFH